jgi:glyoxylase-like metal-dependent hydrolase (beta-lactamase superfamily II)
VIARVLDDAGPGWAGVRHVLLTHKHPDHTGSLGDVLAAADRATGYVGEADLAEVEAPRRLTAVRDGDEVFGLRVVATPGHTPGHVSLFDPTTRVLVAGDALANMRGLTGSPPQYTEDQATADASVGTLAALEPATILVGHGAPVSDGAAQALRRLAAQVSA